MIKVIEHIEQYVSLTSEEKLEIANTFERKKVAKHTILLREHQQSKSLFFIESGLIRSFYSDKEKERTHWIYAENDFFTAWYSFFLNQPSFESFEAIEDTSFWILSQSNYETLCTQNAAFSKYIRLLFEQSMAEIDYILKTFSTRSAKEKYDYLLETKPELLQRVKLGYIASLLGISQETLSRVRAQ